MSNLTRMRRNQIVAQIQLLRAFQMANIDSSNLLGLQLGSGSSLRTMIRLFCLLLLFFSTIFDLVHQLTDELNANDFFIFLKFHTIQWTMMIELRAHSIQIPNTMGIDDSHGQG